MDGSAKTIWSSNEGGGAFLKNDEWIYRCGEGIIKALGVFTNGAGRSTNILPIHESGTRAIEVQEIIFQSESSIIQTRGINKTAIESSKG